jgi:N,N'-diacetyllegionaminate synthase
MRNKKTIIIAEAGVNHNQDIRIAYKLIRAAKKSGADYIKFQTFVSKNLTTKHAKLANYQEKNIKKSITQQSMLKKLELPYSWHLKLINYSQKIGIKFLSTPFDIESVIFLQKFNLDFIKIPSGEITNLLYLKFIGKLNKRIVLSTGMSSLLDIKKALKVLIQSGTYKKNITILHCHTDYPSKFTDLNLRAINTIKNYFKVNVGYSDHSTGIEAPIAAVAMGSSIIEKHFTLDRKMKGPDHKASLLPEELSLMISSIRNIEKALGDGIKKATKNESKNIIAARKSIIAKNSIQKGERFTYKNLEIKRPGSGISPMNIEKIIGQKSKFKYSIDQLINKKEISS